MQSIKVAAQARTEFGKKANKKLRASGSFPAIIYGGAENTAISLTPKAVKPVVYTPDFNLVEIEVGGQTSTCILKEVIFHPVTDEIVHMDFLRVIEGTPIKVEIPVGFKGESPGVKGGGKLIAQMRKVKVKTLPSKMVDKLYADISSLELGQSVRVRDLELPEGMEVMTTGATPVALVEVPRALRSAAAAAEASSEGAAE